MRTDAEELVYNLGKDVAVMAETQRSCQKYQVQTTSNINKLTDAVDTLAKEAIRLEGIFANIANVDKRIDQLETNFSKRLDRIEVAYATWTKVVFTALLVGVVGIIFKFVGA